MKTWNFRGWVAGGLVLTLAWVPTFGQNATKTPPVPTAAQRAIIDKDNSRHFGDDPDDGGPMAKLSPVLRHKDVEAAMRKVADWELTRSQPYFDSIWTWSALYVGFIAASDATGDAKYRDAVEAYAVKKDWKLESSHLPNADNQSIGEAYIDLYAREKDPARKAMMIAPTREQLDELNADPTGGTPRGHDMPWWWCDALFMAPPLWTRMSAATGDPKYLAYSNREWWKTSDLLYNTTDHLYARDASYLNRKEANGKPMYWSRGNGWVMGGLVRVLESLPKDDAIRPKYVTQFKEMSAKVASLQGRDGLWRAGLLDPETYVMSEDSGSSFFVYAMAWGVNDGLLDAKTYKPIVAKGWAGLLKHVYADGRLGGIQQTGAEPAFFKPTASYNYGIGAFLLAGKEVDRMAKGEKK